MLRPTRYPNRFGGCCCVTSKLTTPCTSTNRSLPPRGTCQHSLLVMSLYFCTEIDMGRNVNIVPPNKYSVLIKKILTPRPHIIHSRSTSRRHTSTETYWMMTRLYMQRFPSPSDQVASCLVYLNCARERMVEDRPGCLLGCCMPPRPWYSFQRTLSTCQGSFARLYEDTIFRDRMTNVLGLNRRDEVGAI